MRTIRPSWSSALILAILGCGAIVFSSPGLTPQDPPGQTATAQTTGQTGTTGQTTTGQTTTGQTTGQPTTGQATTGQTTTGQTTTGQNPPAQVPPVNPPAQDPTKPAVTPEEAAKTAADSEAEAVLAQAAGVYGTVFGYDYFASARQAIEARRARIAATPVDPNTTQNGGTGAPNVLGADAFAAGQVVMPSPDRYQLGPGDKILITVSAPFRYPAERPVVVDARGRIRLPEYPEPITVRGQTPAQLERSLRTLLQGVLKNAEVTVALDELRTINVSVLGDAYAPGAYLVPSTTTLFNMLYAAGGPSYRGSLRAIQLKRANSPMRTFDLYRLLLRGDGSQDVSLQPGDVIFVPPTGSRVIVKGEVARPSTYELRAGERLKDMIRFAGGAQATGISRRVSVTTVRPGSGRVLRDFDLSSTDPTDNPVLYNGDTVEIFDVGTQVGNLVSVEGPVFTPRAYGFRRGMRVSDLIEAARGLRFEAFGQRADLYRPRADGSLELIRVDLSAAVKKEPAADVALEPGDRLRVYSLDEVQFLGNRNVFVKGAVRNPGNFRRAEGMRLRDLLLQAAGLQPNAYGGRAFLRRTNPDGTPGPNLPINLTALLAGDETQNILLQDLDELNVQSVEESGFRPEQQVQVSGAVQRPGNYPIGAGQRLRELLQQAGETLPTASEERAFLQRVNPDGTPGPILTLDLRKVRAGDAESNVVLQPGDRLTVLTIREANFRSADTVELSGAIQRPGEYTLNAGMRLSDLVRLAGGPTADADTALIFVQRTNPDGTQGPLVTVNFTKLLAGDAATDLVLQSRDRISLFTREQAQYRQPETVRVQGAVQRQGEFPRSANLTLADVLKLAGGTLPNSAEEIQIAHANRPAGTRPETFRVADVLAGRVNPLLEAGDLVLIPQRSDIVGRPFFVTITGAVRFPGPYLVDGKTERLSNLIKRAGGLADDGYLPAAQFTRDPQLLVTPRQIEQAPKLLEMFRLVSDEEYKRAAAMADVDRLRIVFAQGASISSGGSALSALGGGSASAAGTVNPGVSMDQALAQAVRAEAVTKARPFAPNELMPAGNLNVDFRRAVSRPGSIDDIVLKDGDVISVPLTPTTVNVVGAVAAPANVIFRKGANIEYYVQHAGGLTSDADVKSVVIVRASGEMVRFGRGVQILLGDTVVVPTKVMAVRLNERKSDLEKATSIVTSAGITLALIKALAR